MNDFIVKENTNANRPNPGVNNVELSNAEPDIAVENVDENRNVEAASPPQSNRQLDS